MIYFRTKCMWPVMLLMLWLSAPMATAGNSSENEPPRKGGELFKRPYQYYADGEPAHQAIENFSKSFGLVLKGRLNRQVSLRGRIGGETAHDFMQQLSQTQGFQWFMVGKELYIADKSDFVTKAVSVAQGSADSIQKALTDIKILDPEFGWGSIPEESIVLLSGPRQYVDMVAQHIGQLNKGYQNQVQVFKLKYASVDDRISQYRDREIQTPGVAQLLKKMTENQSQQNKKGLATNRTDSVGSNPQSPDASLKSNTPRSNDTPLNISSVVKIESDSRLNAIIIKDHPSQMPIWAAIIKELDVPSQLVEIEASILEIESSKFSDLGIDFAFASNNFGFNSKQRAQPSALGGIQNEVNLGLGKNSSVLVNDLKGFNARIRALEAEGNAKTLASPSILTTDNLAAFLDLSQTFYSKVLGERVANLIPVTAGTTLRVTPHIINETDGQRIQLVLDIEDGGLTDGLNPGDPPIVKKTNISTQALIREGQSLLIGGYNLDASEQSTSKIPFLGDLPVFGGLFNGKRNTNNSRKRLFLISPRIVRDEVPSKAMDGISKKLQIKSDSSIQTLKLTPSLNLIKKQPDYFMP